MQNSLWLSGGSGTLSKERTTEIVLTQGRFGVFEGCQVVQHDWSRMKSGTGMKDDFVIMMGA